MSFAMHTELAASRTAPIREVEQARILLDDPDGASILAGIELNSGPIFARTPDRLQGACTVLGLRRFIPIAKRAGQQPTDVGVVVDNQNPVHAFSFLNSIDIECLLLLLNTEPCRTQL